MKSLLTGLAAIGLIAIWGYSADVAAGTAETGAASVGEVTILEHGRHWRCEQGPRGWWHRNMLLTGLPVPCLLPR